MNKYSIITAIAIAAIIIPFIYSGINIGGAQQLEYRWNNPGQFSFFAMSNSGDIEFCNTIPFWTSFQKFEIVSFYQGKQLGSFTTNPVTVNPYSSTIQEGVFTSEQIQEAQHNFMTFDYEFDGGTIRLDPNQFIVLVRVETPIIGVIPYSSTTQISGFELDKIMNAEDLSCN